MDGFGEGVGGPLWRFCVDGLGQASGGSIRRSVVAEGRLGLCEDFVWTDLGRVLVVLCEDWVWMELGRERTARSEDLLWKTLHGRGGGTFVKILCGRIWEGRLLAVPFGNFFVWMDLGRVWAGNHVPAVVLL